MITVHSPPKCFDYFSSGKVTGRAFILSRRIQIWNSGAIFCYSPIWSPAAPVSRLHCSALLLVARTSCQDDSGEGGGRGGGSQPGGASWPQVAWWSGGGILYCQPKLVFANQRRQLTCFVYLFLHASFHSTADLLHVPPAGKAKKRWWR